MKDAGADAATLSVDRVTVRFGGVVALDGVSFRIEPQEIYGLIGPNGAGKTTLFNCISRLYAFESGDIFFGGRSLSGVPAHRIAGLGMGRTFQNLALFGRLSVLQNIMLGSHCRLATGWIANALRSHAVRNEEARCMDEAETLIDFLGLRAVRDAAVEDLPFGIAKKVELGRAMASRPSLLLLDEPAAGLNHEEVQALGTMIRAIRDRHKCAVLLIEHHMGLVMSIADRIGVLDFGELIAQGRPAQIRTDPAVLKSYLGEAA
jgi:branched-chain amino acid transport system ATP-binding protein